MSNQATVGDLVRMLMTQDPNLPMAIEDGEFGPLLCDNGVSIGMAEARHGEYSNHEKVMALVISHA